MTFTRTAARRQGEGTWADRVRFQAPSFESVLILFSSFLKDVTQIPSPKLTGMIDN